MIRDKLQSRGICSIRWQWGKLLPMSLRVGKKLPHSFIKNYLNFSFIFCRGLNIPILSNTLFLPEYVNLCCILGKVITVGPQFPQKCLTLAASTPQAELRQKQNLSWPTPLLEACRLKMDAIKRKMQVSEKGEDAHCTRKQGNEWFSPNRGVKDKKLFF